MNLSDIGFYTLCDVRASYVGAHSPMWRCEMILTDRCNFKCPYCRGLRDECQGDIPLDTALTVLDQWISDSLGNVRFSGGEPLLYPHLDRVVTHCREGKVGRIAISTNGSFKLDRYVELVELGVNDFSISFDACCASVCGKMSGGGKTFGRICDNIRALSKLTYVTVGVVLTDDNLKELVGIVTLAHELGVADIRIIPAAQEGCMIEGVESIPQEILDAHPILAYRVHNIKRGRPVRSIDEADSHRCFIPIDDSVVSGQYHFPCVIYMREGGEPIGEISADMRAQRIRWSETHNSFNDPICRANCLDVCIDHNNKCAYHKTVDKLMP